jgi:hypothetical protein
MSDLSHWIIQTVSNVATFHVLVVKIELILRVVEYYQKHIPVKLVKKKLVHRVIIVDETTGKITMKRVD